DFHVTGVQTCALPICADNFVPGLITNAVYGTVFLVSALIGWSLIGIAAGFLMGDATAWRADRRKRRAFRWLGIAWAALFFARLRSEERRVGEEYRVRW